MEKGTPCARLIAEVADSNDIAVQIDGKDEALLAGWCAMAVRISEKTGISLEQLGSALPEAAKCIKRMVQT